VGPLDPALADLLGVDVEGDGAALADAAAVVGELHPRLVGAGGQLRVGADVGAQDTDEVVGVAEPSLVGVQRPAAEVAALGAGLGHVDLGGHRVGVVLDVDDRVLL
jgi:hypothetical protein